MENLDRDLSIIFNDILGVQISEVIHFNDAKSQNEKNEKKEKEENTKKYKTLKYLSQLTKLQREQLFEIYKHDFEMFEYDPYMKVPKLGHWNDPLSS